MPLTEMWTRVEVLSDRQARHELQTATAFWEVRQRLGEVERRLHNRPRAKNRSADLLTFLGEVATIKQWVVGVILVLLALKGTFSASEWKAIFLALIGAGSTG